ncbi:MAG: hypothetical protein ACRCX2_36365 [Paraclostridium sp.]
MQKEFSLENLGIPSYCQDRIYLKDPSEVAFIDDLAASMESDLTVINGVVAYETLDLFEPNVLNQLGLGLENRFTEMAKSGYYKLKQRAKQLFKYVFGFFLNFLRGSTDAKAIVEKHYKKIKDYKKAFDNMRPSNDSDKEVDIRDVKDRILNSVTSILVITQGLEEILNASYADKDKNAEARIVKFAMGINSLNSAMITGNFTKDINQEIMDKSGVISKTTIMEKLAKLIKDIYNTTSDKLNSNSSNDKIEFDNNSNVKEKLSEVKDLYKEEVDKTSMSYSEAYTYMKTALTTIEALIDPKKNNWDFKKIAKKVSVVSRNLEKEVERMGDEAVEEKTTENKSTGNAIQIIMSCGSFMSTTKEVMAIVLKSFKSDMDIFFTECSKVGSILHKKQS